MKSAPWKLVSCATTSRGVLGVKVHNPPKHRWYGALPKRDLHQRYIKMGPILQVYLWCLMYHFSVPIVKKWLKSVEIFKIPLQDGPPTIVINGVKRGRYRWPKKNGFHWGYSLHTWRFFTVLITGDGAHRVMIHSGSDWSPRLADDDDLSNMFKLSAEHKWLRNSNCNDDYSCQNKFSCVYIKNILHIHIYIYIHTSCVVLKALLPSLSLWWCIYIIYTLQERPYPTTGKGTSSSKVPLDGIC